MSARLRPGQRAPEFEALNWDGARVRLADLRGAPVWLALMRYAGCPLCNLRVHEMVTRYEQLAARGLKVLAVIQSPQRSIAEYMAGHRAPFPLLADPDESLHALYAAEHSLAGYLAPANLAPLARAAAQRYLPGRMEGTKTRLPADFLIDREGVLRDVFYGSTISEHIPFERVEAFVAGA